MTPQARLRTSLDGLSVGDAFGERFFGFAQEVLPKIDARELPAAPWSWTDDTEMAVVLADHLLSRGSVDQTALAQAFADAMTPERGYGRGAYEILTKIQNGGSWKRASRGAFSGLGSFGNGAAMRVAPLGAFLAGADIDELKRQARLSAEVTHAHAEGVAGAIAVAVATAFACTRRLSLPFGADWLRDVCSEIPTGYTRETIEEALSLEGATLKKAAFALGNGTGVTAPDTVPLCLWICAYRATGYVEAMWETVSVLGDRDTTCAIVGGILAPVTPPPPDWIASREALASESFVGGEGAG